VQRLLERARELGLKIRYLLLDREFYNVPVVQYLQGVHCPFMMPVVHRGRRLKPHKTIEQVRRLTGTKRFLCWRRSGFSQHRMNGQATVKIAVVCPAAKAATG
jgi:hypothetical protein